MRVGGAGGCSPANILLYTVRAWLHFLVFGAAVTFFLFIITWIGPTDDYYGGKFYTVYNLWYTSGPAEGTTVVSGYDLSFMAWQWVPTLAAIFAVILLGILPRRTVTDTRSLLYQLRVRTRALMMWQTPLHRFWVYWCGGLSIADLLVVATYLTIHVYWLVTLVHGRDKYYAALEETGVPLLYSLSVHRLGDYAIEFGVLLWPSLWMLFFPMAHISFLSDWLGTHYADMIRWHRWIGQGVLWITSVHGLLYYAYWGLINDFWRNFSDWSHIQYINNLAGSIAWFFSLALWATSLQWVRRHFFEIFYRFHIVCFIMFVIFGTIHYAYAWTWWLPGLIIYGLDVVLRAGQSLNSTTIKAFPAEDSSFTTVEITLAKGFKCKPNEEIFLLIPQLSNWQWHPFSVYEVLPNPNGTSRAVVHIKVYNKWTTELCTRAKLGQPLAARLAGPLGRNRDEAQWLDYSTIVLVGGGIGAIPVLTILNDIIAAATKASAVVGEPLRPPAGVRKVVFIWVSRHGSDFSLVDEKLLQTLKSCSEWLDVKFHITTPLPEKPQTGLSEYKPSRVDPKWLPLTHHWASPLRLRSDRPAQARLSGPILEILVAIFTFAGAFFGTILSHAYLADASYNGATSTYDYFWKSGLIIIAVQTVMILGLPYAVIILPVTFYRAWADRRYRLSATPSPTNSESSLGDNGKVVKAPHLSVEAFLAQTAAVSYDRPDVYSVIGKAVAEEKGHVAVFAGGPDSLRAAANNATYSMRQKFNLFGRLVHYFDESFEL